MPILPDRAHFAFWWSYIWKAMQSTGLTCVIHKGLKLTYSGTSATCFIFTMVTPNSCPQQTLWVLS